MGWGAGTALVVFLPLVRAGSLSAWVLAVLCVCMSNPGDSKKSPGGDKRHFLLRVPPFFFFFLPPLDLKTNSDQEASFYSF